MILVYNDVTFIRDVFSSVLPRQNKLGMLLCKTEISERKDMEFLSLLKRVRI